ncbi:isochorismatase family protein [Streptomyces sp. NBC_01363]|uniref:isochorismatase family protein n=1 Tax=Streptomyces sp. NBC_01363 TaxID=2903840 RepID=UPI00224E0861|nr:isochorismatase family protein [Streptomyces sp. NBC_01363]MCX4735555.1 isochorismatase family protein [Streptomyces sp. NBC_01363]
MALPAIAPYPMPTADELPTNRVPWVPDPERALLLVHDLQNHFLGAFTDDESPLTELLVNVERLTTRARRAGVPVVYSALPGGRSPAQRGLQQDFWGPGLPYDAHAQAIPAPLEPQVGDTLLTKRKYSAFARTRLLGQMRDLGRDQLIVVGVYAHIGVLMSACDAWTHDIQTFLVADAVADFSREDHEMALRWAAGTCAAVTTTDLLLGEV